MGKWRRPKPKPRKPYQRKAKAEEPKSIKVGILLDGDADYFSEEYTSRGRKGGRLAAIELQKRVENYFRSQRNIAKGTRIDMIAYSFSNYWGLSRFLGVNIRTFANGFNSSPFDFSMEDAGGAPQAADEALKNHLPSLLSSCDFVLFGGSHDNGYHDTLASHEGTELFDKIILLRTGSQAGRRILSLGLKEVWFNGLFGDCDSTKESEDSGSNSSNSEDSGSEDSDSEDSDSEDSDSEDSGSESSKNEGSEVSNDYENSDISLHTTSSSPSTSPPPPLDRPRYTMINETTIPQQFRSLVTTLRTCPSPVPFATVAWKMVNEGNKVWNNQSGTFSRYIELAAQADILTISSAEDEQNGSWIRLSVRYWLAYKYVPFSLVPLLEAIMSFSENGPRCSVVAALLHKDTRQPFEGRRWKTYLAEAIELGLVETGHRGTGEKWVEVTDGLWV